MNPADAYKYCEQGPGNISVHEDLIQLFSDLHSFQSTATGEGYGLKADHSFVIRTREIAGKILSTEDPDDEDADKFIALLEEELKSTAVFKLFEGI